MNVLTADLISLIVTRSYSIIKHDSHVHWNYMFILHLDQNGHYHRINGPAIVYSTDNWDWRFHGKRHRHIKPAVSNHDFYSWYSMGKFVARRKKIKLNFFAITNERLNCRPYIGNS